MAGHVLDDFDGNDDGALSPAKITTKYEKLGLADAISRPYDYCSSCQELAVILRRAYVVLPRAVQSLIFRDTLSAFGLLSNVEPSIGIPAAHLLVQAAEATLPKQKKTLASSEFKHAVVAQRRRGRVHHDEVYFSGYMDLPQDILHLVFRFLDIRSFINSSSVCWAWNKAAKDNRLWMSHHDILFGRKGLSDNTDWRGAFKRKYIERSAWRSRPHRAFCVLCGSILWLSAITCNSPHRCPKSEDGRLQIRPISSYMLVDYLLTEGKSYRRNNWAYSSSDSDDSDSDLSPAVKLFSKNWALPKAYRANF